jgi:hypothetical protein
MPVWLSPVDEQIDEQKDEQKDEQIDRSKGGPDARGSKCCGVIA